MDIRKWLEEMGLGSHAPTFEKEGVDSATLADLTAEDLKEPGVAKLGHRRKLNRPRFPGHWLRLRHLA